MTGEGKTVAMPLAAYLNASLRKRGVHGSHRNDYRKAMFDWGESYIHSLTYSWLCVCVITSLEGDDRKAAYMADITYGTNNEFALDLRDNG